MAFGSERERDVVPLGTGFDIVKRGYSRTQVEEHLERLDKELKLIALDRDAATAQAADMYKQMGQARTEISDLRSQVNRLSAPPTTLEGLSERLQRMLRLAQDESNEIKARAEADAGQIRARAEADANSLRARYENLIAEVDGRRVELENEHRELMEKAHADIEARNKAAEAARNKLDSEAAARRQQIEEDFDIAMSSRRTESMRVLAEQEATSKAEAERRVREATDEATRIRTQVNEETTALRTQVAEEQRVSRAEADKRLRESSEEATRVRNEANAEASKVRAAIAEEQRSSKAEAEKRLRESTEEANKRRHEAAAEAQARLQDATDEAHRRVREATEESNRRIAAATARVESLRALRTQLAEQLRAAHALMVNATPQLDPLPEEHEEDKTQSAKPKAEDKPQRPDQRTVPIADNAAGPAQPAGQQTKVTTAVKVPDPNRPTMEVNAVDAPTRRTGPVTPPNKPGQAGQGQGTRPGQQPNQPQQGPRQQPSVKR
ncbi:MAG TPA: chromosome segregation protein [Pseudonocardiaceae bacterium]|nr:chromosome segregation protein [Pseudonocardiaceae bacterium]